LGQDYQSRGQLVSNLEQVNVGTTLIVQPQLGESDEVLLHVRLEADSLRATDPTTGLPEIGQRSAEGALRVKDGDTVMVAGLELSDATKARRAIPVLGALPLVGSLFRMPANSGSATHLAVFMTPHIVKPGAVQQTAAAAPDGKGGHRSG
jgi:type II secretory pathway component GspD/PulD (secretin)